jgi:hypothetical protein
MVTSSSIYVCALFVCMPCVVTSLRRRKTSLRQAQRRRPASSARGRFVPHASFLRFSHIQRRDSHGARSLADRLRVMEAKKRKRGEGTALVAYYTEHGSFSRLFTRACLGHCDPRTTNAARQRIVWWRCKS